MKTETKSQPPKQGHTPGPWQWRDISGAGIQIYGPVPFKANCVEFTLKASEQRLFEMADLQSGATARSREGYPMLAYETWLQFAPKEWEEMQRANAALIAASPDLLAALQDMFRMMDEGLLVRDTANDGASDWAIKQLRFVARLKKAQAALTRAKGGE